MSHKVVDLLIAFGRTGLVGFGGGPSMIPIIQHEVVKKYRWMSEESFSDLLALANVLPGPIATKLPGYVGYQVAGVLGCVVAVSAITLPMIVLMIVMMGLFYSYQELHWVQNMSYAVMPVVAVLMLQLTLEFGSKSKATIGWKNTLYLALVAVIVIVLLSFHPAWLVLALLAAAVLMPQRWIDVIKRVFRT
jgi:chromate transporter